MANFTKKAIRDSLVKLLNEKPLSKITVRDIVDDCGSTGIPSTIIIRICPSF